MLRIYVVVTLLALAVPAAAQERPFLFSIATAPNPTPTARVDYDIGVGERAFQGDDANQPEQRLGLHATYRRLTMLARIGIVQAGSSYQSAQSGELLYSLTGQSSRFGLAAGGGALHEADGVTVLLARVAASRNAPAWLLHGNVLFQKPLSSVRDSVDLITSVGWARKLSAAVSLGAEAIGEDLEGFWEEEEAEGGARLLIGPSLHIAPAKQRWQLIAMGGPLFHPADTGRSSTALRDLPAATTRTGYAFKASVSISLNSDR